MFLTQMFKTFRANSNLVLITLATYSNKLQLCRALKMNLPMQTVRFKVYNLKSKICKQLTNKSVFN